MPAGASKKREREYEKLKREFKKEHRYPGREEEVASRIVNKQRREYGETKGQTKQRREGKAPDANLPIRNFQTLTVSEAKPKLQRLDARDLKTVRQYETKHKNRKTMLEAIDRQLDGKQKE